jgi:hypothetical protein
MASMMIAPPGDSTPDMVLFIDQSWQLIEAKSSRSKNSLWQFQTAASVLEDELGRFSSEDFRSFIATERFGELVRGVFRMLCEAQHKDWVSEFEKLAPELLSQDDELERLKTCHLIPASFCVLLQRRHSDFLEKWRRLVIIRSIIAAWIFALAEQRSLQQFVIRERQYYLLHGAHPPRSSRHASGTAFGEGCSLPR